MVTIRCKSCGHEFDADVNTIICPSCGSDLTVEDIKTITEEADNNSSGETEGDSVHSATYQPMTGNYAPQGQRMPYQPPMMGYYVPQGQQMPYQPQMMGNYVPQGQQMPYQPQMMGNNIPQVQQMPYQQPMQGYYAPQGQQMPYQQPVQGNYMPQGRQMPNQPPVQVLICKECGEKIQPGAKFCKYCGRHIAEDSTVVQQNEDWTKKAENAVNEATDAVVDVSKRAWNKAKDFFKSL